MQKTRSCLIVSPDEMNRNVQSVIVAPLTTNFRNIPSRIKIEASTSNGLTETSYAALDQIKTSWEDWEEWEGNYDFVVGYVMLLPLKTSAKRVNIMLDETLLAQIDKVTKNRSSFLAEAARRMLGIAL